MNIQFFTLASVHLITSLIIGVVFLYLTFIIVRQFFRRRKLPTETTNVAFGVFAAAVMFTVGYILSGVFEPAMTTANILIKGNTAMGTFIPQYMKYMGLFLLFGSLATGLVIFTAIKVFDLFTASIDELLEISKNNMSVSIVLSTMIIVIAVIAKPSIVMLVEAIVPYPQIMSIGL